jgi:hypothetical protein
MNDHRRDKVEARTEERERSNFRKRASETTYSHRRSLKYFSYYFFKYYQVVETNNLESD